MVKERTSENRHSKLSNLCFHGLLVLWRTEHLALPILFHRYESQSAVIKLSTDMAPLCFWQTVSIYPLSKETRSCQRWTEVELDHKLSVRNEITKGIIFNDVYWTGENKRCVEKIESLPIPWSRMAATRWSFNTEIYLMQQLCFGPQ